MNLNEYKIMRDALMNENRAMEVNENNESFLLLRETDSKQYEVCVFISSEDTFIIIETFDTRSEALVGLYVQMFEDTQTDDSNDDPAYRVRRFAHDLIGF